MLLKIQAKLILRGMIARSENERSSVTINKVPNQHDNEAPKQRDTEAETLRVRHKYGDDVRLKIEVHKQARKHRRREKE